ncbi:MAG: SDR family NAD(P)-dependent oxidoreductase [Acidobacteriota bacterium]
MRHLPVVGRPLEGFAQKRLAPVLDASIVCSFDASGFERHALDFDADDLAVDLSGRRILVTGANSGLGAETAHRLTELGAEIWMLCRDVAKGEAVRDQIAASTGRAAPRLEALDVADAASIDDFAARLGDRPVHGLIHNAGVLPLEREETRDGLERCWATHCVGPLLLTWRLRDRLAAGAAERAEGARVLFITSGGMYAKRLNLDDIQWLERTYDGVAAYAVTKRAQMVLTEQLADHLRAKGIDVNAMHPGWADTPSVERSLPRFHRLMKGRLRTVHQGADTIVWLAAAAHLAGRSGELFFDRRSAPSHKLPWTRARSTERRRFWRRVFADAGLVAPR